MTVAAFLLLTVAVAVMVIVHLRLERRADERRRLIDEADAGRQHALYKQHKDLTRRIAAAERATAKMIDETRTAAENSRLLNERADTLLREVKHGR